MGNKSTLLFYLACIFLLSIVFVNPLDAAPRVVATNPINAEAHVAVNAVVQATFDGAMAPATINASSFSLMVSSSFDGYTNHPGAVTYDAATKTATFTPFANFVSGTMYIATISPLVKDIAGNSMASPFAWNFTTVGSAPPQIISTDPAVNAGDVPLNAVISITFDREMNAATINAETLTLHRKPEVQCACYGCGDCYFGLKVTGTVAYDPATRTATFTPARELVSSSAYYVLTTSGVRDASGNNLSPGNNGLWWQFTTRDDIGNTGNCFVSAAYGSDLHPHVRVLRNFRDTHVLTNPWGKVFTNFYYTYSPATADMIRKHRSLKTATRWVLTPLVYAVQYPGLLFLLPCIVVLFSLVVDYFEICYSIHHPVAHSCSRDLTDLHE